MVPFALATVRTSTGPRCALQVGERLYLLGGLDPAFAEATNLGLVQQWDAVFPQLERLAADAVRLEAAPFVNPEVLTPLMYPDKLLAVGANYSGHLAEMGLAPERWAIMPFFLRPPKTSLVGPGATVIIPKSTQQFDWECELAVVVGRRLRDASRAEASAAVAGYSIGLDMSCRDLILTNDDLKVDLTRGKLQDTMAPCGPAIVPAAFVANVDDLRITLAVNGETMMDASTAEMLYKIDEQLSIISSYITLEPGDILFTGSPSGSAGVHGNRWLKPGDVIRATIESVGTLEVEMRAP